MELHVTTPKTRAGIRIIPMFNDVKRTLLAERLKQMEKEKKIESFANLEGKIKIS